LRHDQQEVEDAEDQNPGQDGNKKIAARLLEDE
jgi:hypothetical protein